LQASTSASTEREAARAPEVGRGDAGLAT